MKCLGSVCLLVNVFFPSAGRTAGLKAGRLAGLWAKNTIVACLVAIAFGLPESALAAGDGGAQAPEAKAAIVVFTKDGGRHRLSNAWSSPDSRLDSGQKWLCESLRCVLVKQETGHFLTGVPIAYVVSAGVSEGGHREFEGTCRLIFRDDPARGSGYAEAVGGLMTGICGDEGRYAAGDIRGFDVPEGYKPDGPSADLKTGWSAAVTDASGCSFTLEGIFLLDSFLSDGEARTRARSEIGLRVSDVLFTIPLELIADLERLPGAEPLYRVTLPGQVTLVGRLQLGTQVTAGRIGRLQLGDLDEGDYLVGHKGRMLLAVSMTKMAQCRSCKAPEPPPQPLGPFLRLTRQDAEAGAPDGAEVVVFKPTVDSLPESGIDAGLAEKGGLILGSGGGERLGLQLSAIRAITPASHGRVVVQTRAGAVFAGTLMTPLAGVASGAKVNLGPEVFTRYRVDFGGNWPPFKPDDVVTESSVAACVRLTTGNQRDLSRVFVLHGDQGDEGLQLRYGMEFPVCANGLQRWVDLRFVRIAERPEKGSVWRIRLHDGQTFSGVLDFSKTAPSSGGDFICGFDKEALDFVPIPEILAIEVSPAEKTPNRMPSGANSQARLVAGEKEEEEVRGFNITFPAPEDMPALMGLATGASEFFRKPDGVVRMLDVSGINRVEAAQRQEGSVRVFGALPPFEAKLYGPLRADMPWGWMGIPPRCLRCVEFSSVPEKPEKSRLPEDLSVLPVEVVTTSGTVVKWDEAWVGDIYRDYDQGCRVLRHVAGFTVSDAAGERVVPLAEIEEIQFEKDPNSGKGTRVLIRKKTEPRPASAQVMLYQARRGDSILYGPLDGDLLAARISPLCIEALAFSAIKSIKILSKGGDHDR